MADTESPEVANDSLEPLFDDDWDTYNLEWLFDPDRTDHLTIDEQLKLYQQRNLRRTKVYKFASKIWGSPASRKRVFYASSHNVPQYGEENVLRKAKLEKDALAQLEKDSEHLASGLKATEVLREYKIWINERKKFRNQIDLMRLSEEWLRRKPDKTGQEQRVLARMIEKKLIRPPSPVVVREEPPLLPVLPTHSPIVARPSPVAIKIIERFLHEKKLRLIDLFKSFDKNKTWLVSGNDFKKAIKKAGIPISDVMLDDLMVTLDMDLNDKLDYRELTKGLGLWKVEKRERKQQKIADTLNSPAKLSQLLGFEPPEGIECNSPTGQADRKLMNRTKSTTKSSNSGATHKTGYLEVPALDLREERFVQRGANGALKEMNKKRPQGSLRKNKKQKSDITERVSITTTAALPGAATSHLNPSTLGGEAGPLVDRFRQLQFKEYQGVQKMCQESTDLQLNEQSLKKAIGFQHKVMGLSSKFITLKGNVLQLGSITDLANETCLRDLNDRKSSTKVHVHVGAPCA
ncbi:hypothetical protein LSH36_497g02056 [Paralvinella palmiformis]|uniref:EF-hand domain-containing protein n=1 Tax=Paralvinella palmiformis TaxID=53620 RepID=A0AAD9J896_9ANNE|nr:hypothetical protein LSH36_497g02056 [Paralvinella palmiformis]